MDQGISPPWGALPSEQYLIVSQWDRKLLHIGLANLGEQRNWDSSSSLSTEAQRNSLIAAFLALPEIPATWDDVRERVAEGHPTPELQEPRPDFTERVLVPWRPMAVRSVAATAFKQASALDYVWLRTHYGADGDARFAALLGSSQLDPMDNDRVLDDRQLFSAPDDRETPPEESWALALSLVPELASPSEPFSYSRDLDSSLTDMCGGDASWIDELRRKLRTNVEGAPEQDRVTVTVGSAESRLLQSTAFVRSVAIVDRETFETGEICVLLTDTRGNVVRWFRVPAEDAMMPDVLNMRGQLYETEYFEDGEKAGLGDKYRALGEMGRILYRVSDLIEG